MYAIVVFVTMVAIDHLGLGDIIRQTFLILLTADRARACARLRTRRPETRGGVSRALVPPRRQGRGVEAPRSPSRAVMSL